ncbi:MAG TPA: AAA family ATPase [Ignavibacteriaceae bacterium]|nr:AAA family ATPase [Ignavibacteriaceae bacterium]
MKHKQSQDLNILEFRAENFMKLKVVQITPTSNTVVLSGANEQGKSAVLKAILVTLAGKDSLKDIPEPIRKGSEKGEVTLDLGDYIVTRTFTQKDSYLTITNREGAKYGSPQKLLDELFNKNTIDPSEFLSLDEEKQYKQLKSLVKFDIDIDELEGFKKAAFDERTIINREVKQFEARLNALSSPTDDLPTEEIQAAEIIKKINDATKIIAENNEQREELKTKARTFNQLKSIKEEIESKIKSLQDELLKINESLSTVQKEGKELIDPDITQYNNELMSIENTNRKIRQAIEYRKLSNELKLKQQESEKLTSKIKEFDEKKQIALSDAKFPVDGLSFGDNGILYNNIPFSQCSSEERLRVSLSIAMAQNPKLKVILLRDGSLFDSRNMKVIEDLAAENGYQVWIEKVDDSGKVGIVIEDGIVKAVNDDKPVIKETKSTSIKNKISASVPDAMFE